MKRVPTWLIITVVIVLLIASKFIFFAKKEEGAPGAKGKGGPVTVNYYVVSASRFSNDVFAAGRIGALNQVDLVPEVSGKVVRVHFREGEMVSKGDLLLKLNDADLQAQLLKSRTAIKLSEQKLERLKKLIEVNGVSREEFEMQENELASLNADEAYINAQIGKTSLIAPFNGLVGLKNVSEGSFVNSGTPVASLVQVKPVYIEFSVPEKYSQLFRKGSSVSFSAENAESHKTYTASIYAIEPRVDEATKTIRARAMYNGSEIFYAGSFVKVHINLGETDNALMVPTQCVIPTLKGQKVFVSRLNTAVEIPVKIGVRTDRSIQVLEGLAEGDTVIATGLLSVKKDSKLKLLKPVN